MKKLITAIMAICVMVSLAGCGGGSGDLKGFLAHAEGDWYLHGDSSRQMLRISEDGSWELYGALDSEGERSISYSGGADSIRYNSEYKEWYLDSESTGYHCEPTSDGLLMFMGSTYVPAHESINLIERFDGDWYLDGDENSDCYECDSGYWYGTSNGGYLIYRGGDTKELTAIDPNTDEPFAVFTIVGDDEIKTKDGGQTFLRLEDLDDWDDEHNEGVLIEN